MLNFWATDYDYGHWIFLPENLENKPCLVAHIDTVHKQEKDKQIYHDAKKQVYWSTEGLGADDRAGVWAVLDLFMRTPEPHKPIVLLLDGEEAGGWGAYNAVEEWEELYLQLPTMFIEMDRAGANDVVFYSGEPKEFINFMESFGWKEEWGTFSDTAVLASEMKICGANVSCGYYNEHSLQELLYIPELLKNQQRVELLLRSEGARERRPFVPDPYSAMSAFYWTPNSESGIQADYRKDDDWDTYVRERDNWPSADGDYIESCPECGGDIPSDCTRECPWCYSPIENSIITPIERGRRHEP